MIKSLFSKALSFIGGNSYYIYLVAGLVLLSMSTYIFYQKSIIESQENTILEKSNTISLLEESNKETAKQFESYINDNEKTIKLLESNHKEEIENIKKIEKKKGEIRNVENNKDGVIAPILSDTIRWMQSETTNNNI